MVWFLTHHQYGPSISFAVIFKTHDEYQEKQHLPSLTQGLIKLLCKCTQNYGIKKLRQKNGMVSGFRLDSTNTLRCSPDCICTTEAVSRVMQLPLLVFYYPDSESKEECQRKSMKRDTKNIRLLSFFILILLFQNEQ